MYLNIMKNIIKKGKDYLLSEYNKIENILKNENINPNKKGELDYKINILREYMKYQE